MKDVINILGGNKSKVKSEHPEFYEFVSRLPNSNWQVWAAKMYRQDPSGFKKYKDDLEHFSGFIHIKDIADHRFDKTHDTWEKGINELKEKEKKYVDSLKNDKYLIKPSSKVKEIVPIDNEWGWFDLGVSYCTEEGRAMGHCGNKPNHVEVDRVLSLRRKIKVGDQIYHEPHLTFIENSGFLGEMKGRGNEKPSPKYHPHIIQLLKHPRIKTVVGGEYRYENNFSLGDLSKEIKDQLLKEKPSLDVWNINPNEFINKYKYHPIKKLVKYYNPDTRTYDVDGALKDEDVSVRIAALQHPQINARHIDQALNDESSDIRLAAIYHPNATPDHISQALKDKNAYIRRIAIQHPNATPDHISQALNDKDSWVRQYAIERPNVTSEHISQALMDEDEWIRLAAIRHPNATAEHISRALNDTNYTVRKIAVRHPKATADHISQALNDKNDDVRLAAIEHPNATPEHISRALADECWWVCKAAIEHPKATSEHISQALKDKVIDICLAAIKHPNATPEHISQALNDANYIVRKVAIKHPNATTEHISQALGDKSKHVRQAAIKHPKVTSEHINQALNDENEYVRKTAYKIAQKRFPHLLEKSKIYSS